MKMRKPLCLKDCHVLHDLPLFIWTCSGWDVRNECPHTSSVCSPTIWTTPDMILQNCTTSYCISLILGKRTTPFPKEGGMMGGWVRTLKPWRINPQYSDWFAWYLHADKHLMKSLSLGKEPDVPDNQRAYHFPWLTFYSFTPQNILVVEL